MSEDKAKAQYEKTLSSVLDLGVSLGLDNDELEEMVENLLSEESEELESEDADDENEGSEATGMTE